MTPDHITLAAACLMAAEHVTADRIEKAGGKVRRRAPKPRLSHWRKVLRTMVHADPYAGDYRRGHGGVKLTWTIWAYNKDVASAKTADAVAQLGSFCWDMAYEVEITNTRVSIHAFGEEVSDLGRGSYHIRWEGGWGAKITDPQRGDHETPHVFEHRQAVCEILKSLNLKLDVVAESAMRRK